MSGTIQFPPNPVVGQLYTFNGVTWIWTGTVWTNATNAAAWLPLTGGTLTGALGVQTTLAGNQPAPLTVGGQGINYAAYGAIGNNISFAFSSGSPYIYVNGTAYGPLVTLNVGNTTYLQLTGGTLSGTLTGTIITAPTGTFLNLLDSSQSATQIIGHAGAFGIVGVAGYCFDCINGAVTEGANILHSFNKLGTGTVQQFQSSGTSVGGIAVTATSTAFETSSDVRLKTDLQPFDAGPIIDATEVWDFQWKATGERAYGVAAQAAAEVFPSAVSHNDTTDSWGTDYSKYVPLLLNEIKALRARVKQLEAAT